MLKPISKIEFRESERLVAGDEGWNEQRWVCRCAVLHCEQQNRSQPEIQGGSDRGEVVGRRQRVQVLWGENNFLFVICFSIEVLNQANISNKLINRTLILIFFRKVINF